MGLLPSNRASVVIIVVALVVWTTPALVLPVSADIANPTDNIPEGQLFNGTEDGQVVVWERAAYPVRSDDTDAATTVTRPGTLQGQTLGGGSFTSGNDGTDSKNLVATFGAEKNPAGVHDSGSITISVNDGRANSEALGNQDRLDLIAARATGEGGQGVPDDYSDVVTIFGDVDNANANFSFASINEDVTLDGTGQAEESYEFGPGHWVVYATVHESGRNGFEVDGSTNNITVDGDVAIVGVDMVTVQQGQTGVTPPDTANPGDTLDFGLDTTNAFSTDKDGQVTHTVAVYEKGTFDESRIDIVVDQSQFGPDFTLSEDSQVEHSIENVTGVADVEDGIEINGQDLSDGRVARTVGLGAIVDRIADDLGTEDPLTDPLPQGGSSNSETENIDASVTAVSGESRTETISVETFGNFSTGTYQYVAVSQLDTNASAMSTAAGTVTIQSADDGGGGGGGGVGGIIGTVVTTERTDDGTIATIERVAADDPTVSVAVEGAAVESFAVTEASATFDRGVDAESTMSVTASTDRPTNVPSPPVDGRVLGYATVDVEGTLADAVAEGSFTLDLSGSGVGPADVTAYRYDGDEWQRVETRAVGDTSVEVVSPDGYSVFAIGTGETDEPVSTDTPASTATPTATQTPTVTPTPIGTPATPTGAQTPTPTETPGAFGPGFGPIVAVLAVLGAGLLALRRRR